GQPADAGRGPAPARRGDAHGAEATTQDPQTVGGGVISTGVLKSEIVSVSSVAPPSPPEGSDVSTFNRCGWSAPIQRVAGTCAGTAFGTSGPRTPPSSVAVTRKALLPSTASGPTVRGFRAVDRRRANPFAGSRRSVGS